MRDRSKRFRFYVFGEVKGDKINGMKIIRGTVRNKIKCNAKLRSFVS